MTLRPARWEFILAAAFFLLWAIVSGIVLPSLQPYALPGRIWTLYVIGFVAFPALLGVFFLLLLHPRAAYLELDEEGFTLCTFFWPRFFKWVDVSPFQVKRVLFFEQVTFRITSSSRRFFRTLSFPYMYGRKPEALAALLNEWRENAIGQAGAQGEG